ncbi:MAG: RnfABCDGE type electron transport complex subunit D [Verrucomicrobia bacterium]|jgi:Na+-translocating ferredoxin:NAD+ oxidoreductase subunit D|nr:RnfABCDGE type electron transport complex subunit D [Verrucomicrobiota bacterium]
MSVEPVSPPELESPFYRVGRTTMPMAFCTLGGLAILAALYAAFYDPWYMARWSGYVLAGLVIEALYMLLSTGRLRLRSGSSAVTAAILVMTIPANMPAKPVLFALILAIVLARMPIARGGLHLNPALVGRLFLMIAYAEDIVGWILPGMDADAVTTATPIELYHAEEFTYSLRDLLMGRIGGSWEGLYDMVPGGPGEAFAPVILLVGVLLYWRGIVAWRTGVAFVVAFAASCAVMHEPVLFNVFSGAIVFSAVFIAGDPKTTPVSKGGQLAGGIIAGVVNAVIRKHTYYSEGIVFSFLIVCLLAPTLDRIALWLRSRWLQRRRLSVLN